MVGQLQQYDTVWTKLIIKEWVSSEDLKVDENGTNNTEKDDDGMVEVDKYPWLMNLVENYII